MDGNLGNRLHKHSCSGWQAGSSDRLESAASAACNFCSSDVAVAKVLPVRLRPLAVNPAANG